MSQLSRILEVVMGDASIPDDMREAIARLGRSEGLFAAAGPLGKTKTPSRMKTDELHHSDSISRARLHGTRVVAMFEGVAL